MIPPESFGGTYLVTDAFAGWTGYCGTDGKPVGKQRIQTRAYTVRETSLLDNCRRNL